ncbi:glutamate carboxypeptidase [Penicillium diatomitis]|uniref:Glutamate carboxypeptidase n=1 Tax=Penicillium diatomitis TaxID=2819901 RepID=A0A9W9WV86_9EURO|nr:glutamate carboxypeptidase [Penicillium diatomitis]KAJ5477363.1 glutamate carboxypeptidase [Penicillium diatomitis]
MYTYSKEICLISNGQSSPNDKLSRLKAWRPPFVASLNHPELIEYVGVPKTEVARWVGISSAVASICQAIMAVPWGTLSDHVGRKPVILFGLTCTMIISIMLGMSQTLAMVILSRSLFGLMNGNVGILRTMVAEIVPQRELQPRAFSLMPLVWTIGSIFGPAFGGALARPAEKHPELFGGIDYFKRYPFALPNIASACFFLVGITTGFLFLEETLQAKRDSYDPGLALGKALTRPFGSCGRSKVNDSDEERTALLSDTKTRGHHKTTPKSRPSWSQIFTPQTSLILLSYTLMSGLGMSFDSIFPVFLHYPVQNLRDNPDVQLPFKFASGFGVGKYLSSYPSSSLHCGFGSAYSIIYRHDCKNLEHSHPSNQFSTFSRPDAPQIGIFYTIIGIIGMVIQFTMFPPVAKRYGVLKCFKVSAVILPTVFFVAPFTALAPGNIRVPLVLLVMLIKLGAVVFGIPCCTILLTNSASSMSVLGTLNGVGTSFSALGRAAGPALIGASFSWGIKQGYVIFPWWLLGTIGYLSIVPAFWIVEQDGPYREQKVEETEVEEVEQPQHQTEEVPAELRPEDAVSREMPTRGYGSTSAKRT